MKYSLVSFDLQGTLSDASFSDEFWREVLPKLYAERKNTSLDRAQRELSLLFAEIGPYDMRYYSFSSWFEDSLIPSMRHRPHFYEDTLPLLTYLKKRVPLGILSTTTRNFIDLELGENRSLFSHIFSACDDFKIAGKTPEAYRLLAKACGVFPETILHIGDDALMDVENARRAGCASFHFNKNLPRQEVLKTLWNFVL